MSSDRLRGLSDDDIATISQKVMTRFKYVAEKKGERIPGGYLLTIALHFIVLYNQLGQKMYEEHLEYEVVKYFNESLRKDYQRNLLEG